MAIRFGGDPRQILATLLLVGLATVFAIGILVPNLPRAAISRSLPAISRSLHLLSPTCLRARAGLLPGRSTEPVQSIWLRIAPHAQVAAIDRAISAKGLPAPAPAFSMLGAAEDRDSGAMLGANQLLILPLATTSMRLLAAKADYLRSISGVEAVDVDRQGLTTDPSLLLCGPDGHTLAPADQLLVNRSRAALVAQGAPRTLLSTTVPAVVTHTHLLDGTYTLVVFPSMGRSASGQERTAPYAVCFSSSGRFLFAAHLNWQT
jgi:hypothetical protein